MKIRMLFLGIFSLLLFSCGNTGHNIEYGKDDCHWCHMRIMSPKFGSLAETDKGRIYKFDSAECLFHYLNRSEKEHKKLLVTNLLKPETLISAPDAWYLVSDKMPSPMGGFLNAFASQEEAKKMLQQNGGRIFSFDEIKEKYNRK